MSWWGSLSKQFLVQMSRHPVAQKYAREGARYVKNHPSAKKAAALMSNSWIQMRKRMGSSVSTLKSTGFNKDNKNTGYKVRAMGIWNQYKGRIFSFIMVNFMGIVLLFQLGSSVFPMIKQMIFGPFDNQEKKIEKSETPTRAIKINPIDKKISGMKEKQDFQIHKESGSEFGSMNETSFRFANGSNDQVQHSMNQLEHEMFGKLEKPDFSSSFKFRMSEDEEFRSSTENGVVLGSSN